VEEEEEQGDGSLGRFVHKEDEGGRRVRVR
jgi:hypothetical protein